MIKAVLFDLDGTLLPMNMDDFVKSYFGLLAKYLAPYGYEADKLIKTLWSGVGAMVKNDGSILNEDAFWKAFAEVYGEEALAHRPIVDEFYRGEFNKAQAACGFKKEAAEAVKLVREKGKTPVLATNPVFPRLATESRARWAGLDLGEFAAYTTYENCHYCKPSARYYEELLERTGFVAEECIMVGNDFDEDIIPAERLGMRVFLLTDCIINKRGQDYSAYPHGGFDELKSFLTSELK